ncbi:MAG: hypothetical protein AAGJ34_00630 [Pseudomonadota bacterium]
MLGPDAAMSIFIDWTQQKEDLISRVLATRGGWEAWIQAEVTIWAQDQIYPEQRFLREQFVYKADNGIDYSQERVDFMVNDTTNAVLFELKAQSIWSTERSFLNGCTADVEKLRDKVHPDVRTNGKYSLVFAITQNVAQALKDQDYKPLVNARQPLDEDAVVDNDIDGQADEDDMDVASEEDGAAYSNFAMLYKLVQ